MGVEAAQRGLDGDHRHARREHAGGEIELPAEQQVLGIGMSRRRRRAQLVAQALGRGIDLVAHRQKMAQGRVAAVLETGRILHRLGLAQEVLGVLHDDGAQAGAGAGQRVGVDDDAVDAHALGRLVPSNAWAIQPSLRVWFEAEAVSQISIERKCERLG
jgi:hypothetical protein